MRQHRQKESRASIVEGSVWIPFKCSVGVAGALSVLQTPTAEAAYVHVRTEKGPHMSSIMHVLCTYRLLRDGDELGVPPKRTSPTREPTSIPAALRNLGAAIEETPLVHAVVDPIAPLPEDLGVHVYTFRGRPCVIAAAVGRALTYSDDGRGLAEVIRKHWSAEFVAGKDFAVLEGVDLREFKALVALTDAGSVSPNTRSMAVLFETGFDLVLQKTDKPEGQKLRRRLADEVLPKLRRGEPIGQAAPTPLSASGVTLAEVLAIVERSNAPILALLASLAHPPRRAPALPNASQLAFQETTVLVPKEWSNADGVARTATFVMNRPITIYAVNKLIRESLTYVRGDQTFARQRQTITIDASGHRHENPQWFYSPSVVEAVIDCLKESALT